MRAIKRERYGKKELERLKKTLGIVDSEPSISDENMENISELVTMVTTEHIKRKKVTEEDNMDIMDESEIDEIKKFNPKTLRNKNGAYPVWLHPRKIKKTKKFKKNAKSKDMVTRRGKNIKNKSDLSQEVI